ncbi:spherulin 4-like cell surface protein [Diplocarpon rosae]|nr:spherulin 4-like cell surface protein [Diplocarpon rosae]
MALFPSATRKRNCYLAVAAALVIATIIAVVIPLVIILPDQEKTGQKSSILLPLYIYPATNTTWSPLFDVLEARPELNFIVVINPSSGPGLMQYPDEQYSASVAKLNTYSNVRTVGYVRTGYTSRDLSTVASEVSTYSGWVSNSSRLAMHGIFFDEAPHTFSADAVQYMHVANQAVKDATGLQGDKTIIHNPGTVPDARFDDIHTDITVVFEESYAVYGAKLDSLTALSGPRSQYSYLVHSVPANRATDLKRFVRQISERAAYLFVTDNTEALYEAFGPGWAAFTDVVPT